LRIIENSNVTKSDATLTIVCKDERIIKFKFEDAAVFQPVLNTIVKHAIVDNIKNLFCYKYNVGDFNHQKVFETVSQDFNRMLIP